MSNQRSVNGFVILIISTISDVGMSFDEVLFPFSSLTFSTLILLLGCCVGHAEKIRHNVVSRGKFMKPLILSFSQMEMCAWYVIEIVNVCLKCNKSKLGDVFSICLLLYRNFHHHHFSLWSQNLLQCGRIPAPGND